MVGKGWVFLGVICVALATVTGLGWAWFWALAKPEEGIVYASFLTALVLVILFVIGAAMCFDMFGRENRRSQ